MNPNLSNELGHHLVWDTDISSTNRGPKNLGDVHQQSFAYRRSPSSRWAVTAVTCTKLMMLDDCAYSERAVQSYSDNGLNGHLLFYLIFRYIVENDGK